ncbi:MAG TPA: phospholipid carrier-dependent glycosyltransferase [Solirubrobacteraceae bacterium]|jgi:hypothetical protein|nr:phospholipid carrier-dependent glycosyltransferase [Solirubrobacteraceae bacterium]
MALADYLAGAAWLAATLGLLGWSVAVMMRDRMAHLAGAARALAASCLLLAEIVAVHVGPLGLGILSPASVLAAAALVAVATLAGHRRLAEPAGHPPPTDGFPPAPRSGPVSWGLATLGLAPVLVYAAGFLRAYATSGVVASDYTLFHLPGVARWIQMGTLWANNVLVPDFPVGTYPNTGDVIFLAATLPWHNDAFVRLTNVPLLVLVGVSVYAIARELAAPRATAVLFGGLLLSTQAVLVTGLDRVKPDPLMLAMLGTGVLFLLRHRRLGRRADLVIAGLGLGLAFGARWNGITAVAVTLALWAGGTLLVDRRPRQLLGTLAGLVGLVLAAGGVWLVRNWVQTGDPFFPVPVRLGGMSVFSAPEDPVRAHYDFTVGGYLFSGHVLSHSVLPAWRAAFGLPGAILGLGLVATVVRLLLSRRRPSANARHPLGPVTALALGAVLVFVVYLITPGGAFGFPGAPSLALVIENARWAAPALLVAAALCASTAGGIPGVRRAFELAAVVGVWSAVTQGVAVSASNLLVGTGLLVILGVVLAATVSTARVLRGRGRTLRGAGFAVLGLLALGFGQRQQRAFNDARYRHADPTVDWVAAHAPSHRRIGIAGGFSGAAGVPVLAMFGPRLDNRVNYVGPWDGGFLRHYRTAAGYRTALRRGGYDLVLVGRGIPPRDGGITERWTLAAGYAPVARGADHVLMRRLTAAGGAALPRRGAL